MTAYGVLWVRTVRGVEGVDLIEVSIITLGGWSRRQHLAGSATRL